MDFEDSDSLRLKIVGEAVYLGPDGEEDVAVTIDEKVLRQYANTSEEKLRIDLDKLYLTINGEGPLLKKQLEPILIAIGYGVRSIIDDPTTQRNIVSEILHSLNRKNFITNDSLQEAIDNTYQELKK